MTDMIDIQDTANLRAMVAAFIRDSKDELTVALIESFDERFPYVRTDLYAPEERKTWTHDNLDMLASALEENSTALFSSEYFIGHLVDRPTLYFSPLYNFMESTVFNVEVLLTTLRRTYQAQPTLCRALSDCLEDFVLRILRDNITRFAQDELTRGFILKRLETTPSRANAEDTSNVTTLQAMEDANDHLAPSAVLTPREQEILSLVAKGLSNKEIALHYRISAETVKQHVSHILAKLHLGNRTELALYTLNEK